MLARKLVTFKWVRLEQSVEPRTGRVVDKQTTAMMMIPMIRIEGYQLMMMMMTREMKMAQFLFNG